MAVNNSWLVNVSVSINNTVLQPPNFNSCALVGVMTAVPSSWTSSLYQVYTSLSVFITDFSALLATSEAAFDYAQAQRYQYLLNAGSAFFAQTPTPTRLTIFAMAPQTSATNYTTLFSSFTAAQNNFYGFSLCDYILAGSYASVVMSVVVSTSTVTIPRGTTLSTSVPAVTTYTAINDFVIPANAAGTYLIPFYSNVATESHAAASLSITGTISGVTSSTNVAPTVNSIPGYTSALGPIVGLAALRSDSNQKKLFADFKDFTQAGTIQPVGSEDMTCFYHSLNFGDIGADATQSASLSAAVLSKYFTSVFVGSNGLTILSSLQLAGQPTDPTVNTANIGMPGDQNGGSATSLINWDNNVYPAFGSSNAGIGLVQYGYQSNSIFSNQIYLDQVVGADYVQFTVQAALVNLILQSLPSGLPYSDLGIQQIVNAFKAALNQAVGQNILQPFANSAIVATPYALVAPTDITNRVYKDLSFTGKFLSRIQMIQVYVNLSV